MSFLKIGDRAAGAIKSGGTTRRAAKMVTVDIDHPDIESYINWKGSKSRRSRPWLPARRARKHMTAIMAACVKSKDGAATTASSLRKPTRR